MSRGEEICVLNSLRFDLLGLLLISVLFSGSGDFKATFAMIFLAVEKEDQHMWRYEQLLNIGDGADKWPVLTFAPKESRRTLDEVPNLLQGSVFPAFQTDRRIFLLQLIGLFTEHCGGLTGQEEVIHG